MPVRVAFKPLLERIWHAPDDFRLMEPLPPAHRRGIIFSAIVTVLGILLPGESAPPSLSQLPRDAQLNIQPLNEPVISGDSLSNPEQPVNPVLPASRESSDDANIGGIPQTQSVASQTADNSGFNPGGIEEQWRSYRLDSGKTLAQLFRDNGLPPADVYAMARVEGNGKPLSNLQSGQVVKIRQNANSVVTGLAIEGGNGDILFTRQANGRFTRTR